MAQGDYQVYVSFSGEVGSKSENVAALDAGGTYLGDVLGGGGYDELRGLALDSSGRLYVANASKTSSAIDVFSATINADGYSRDLLGTLLTHDTSIAILHPYGIAFDGDNLFVSSQDTNVVSGYAISGTGMPTAKKLPLAAYLEKLNRKRKGDYYGGTFVASAQPVKAGKKLPPPVDPKDGGLSMEGFEPEPAANPEAPAHAVNEVPQAKKPARHSVRGIVFAGKRLYVADEAKNRVGSYGHNSGKFHGWIDATADAAAKPNAIESPVGLALGADGRVYIGSCKNRAIFAYDTSSKTLSLVLSAESNPTCGNALEEVSGLAFTPDGKLLFGSRARQAIYAFDPQAETVTPYGAALQDAPECLLVVPIA